MPGWPRANGAVEAFMKNISKVIKTAETNKQPFAKEMNSFLRAYRSTPHSSTGAQPAELMFNRNTNTSRLPSTICPNKQRYTDAQKQDLKNKAKMKAYSDKRNHAQTSSINTGDIVLFDTQRDRRLNNKSQTRFAPNTYTVIDKKGPMVTVTDGRKRITRNSAFFKPNLTQ